MDRNRIKDMVQSYIVHTVKNTEYHPFGISGTPGPDWTLNFERRHANRITRLFRES